MTWHETARGHATRLRDGAHVEVATGRGHLKPGDRGQTHCGPPTVWLRVRHGDWMAVAAVPTRGRPTVDTVCRAVELCDSEGDLWLVVEVGA